jgi:Effector-associated domain 11
MPKTKQSSGFALVNNFPRKLYLIPRIILGEIRFYVENDDLTIAAGLLSELLEKYSPSQNYEASLLKRRICAIEKQERAGTLDFEKISQERNRLGAAILELASTLLNKAEC